MRRARLLKMRRFAAGALGLLWLAAGSGAGAAQKKSLRTVSCSFSNPRYSGWCRVSESPPENAAPAQVCEGILACLNDVACSKTYCNATEIRGGWKLEAVRTEWKKK